MRARECDFVSVQVRTRAVGNVMFLLTVCLLWFGNPNSCSSFIFTIPGFTDLQVGKCDLYTFSKQTCMKIEEVSPDYIREDDDTEGFHTPPIEVPFPICT